MNRMPETNHSHALRPCPSVPRLGLGPKQLNWLRRNIRAFKQAEEQRIQIQQDEQNAARAAGVVYQSIGVNS
jgi:hypothetical protein